MKSSKFTLNKKDFQKIGVGLLVAVGGAIATYLLEIVPNIDFGAWTPTVVAINSVLVNALRKFLTDYTVRQDDILD